MIHRLLVLVFAGMLVFVGCGGDAGTTSDATASESPSNPDEVTLTEAQLQEVTVETIPVEARPVTRHVELPARVQPEANQEAYATSLVSGRVERLRVGVGARVQKGQVLADVAAPNLTDMVATLRQARDELDRQRRLAARGVAITKNVNAAERDWQAARQRLRSIGVQADRIERVATGEQDLATLPLEAPMSGVVLDRMTTLGAPVHEGESLFHVADLHPIRVVADVFERDLGAIREGQAVTVMTPSDPERVYESTIAQLVPRVSDDRRAAKARVVLDNADGRLTPGMYATVRVVVASDPQPALPSDALRSDAQGSFVVLALGDRTFRRQYVDADATADGVVAVPALQPGARVVTTGAFQIVSAMGGGG